MVSLVRGNNAYFIFSLTTLHSFYNYVWGPWEWTVISKPLYKGTILQRNYREMNISGSFLYISVVKFQGKIFGSHNMTMLYPNLFCNEVCYKGTAL